jgi:lipopolysaccharide transport system permease protein
MSASEREEEWSQVIKPTGGFTAFNLKELWSYRDLILLFVKRDFVAVYKQTILGPAWHIIQPLFTTAVYVMFSGFINISSDGLPRVLFCLSGVVIWNYFSSCLLKTSSTFVGNASIFGKVYFPRLVIPISIVISNLMSFCIQLSLLIPVLLYYKFVKDIHFQPNLYLLGFPLVVFFLAMLGLGMGLIVSALTVRYRDLVYLIAFGVQLAIYVTPVIYPMSIFKGNAAVIASLNPVTPFIEVFRYALLGRGTFTSCTLLYGAISSVVILVIGMITFSSVERDFMDSV